MARTTVNNSDLKSPLYATLGATDRTVEFVRESVTDLQTRLVGLQRNVDKLERDPQNLRAAIEARVNELQARALEVPDKVQGFLEQHEVAYGQLVARGDALVRRVRRQKSTQDTVKGARTTASKAKTTGTQAGNAGRSTASSAKSAAKTASTTAKKQSKSPQSSAKATATSAKKTAKSATKATADATKKVGS